MSLYHHPSINLLSLSSTNPTEGCKSLGLWPGGRNCAVGGRNCASAGIGFHGSYSMFHYEGKHWNRKCLGCVESAMTFPGFFFMLDECWSVKVRSCFSALLMMLCSFRFEFEVAELYQTITAVGPLSHVILSCVISTAVQLQVCPFTIFNWHIVHFCIGFLDKNDLCYAFGMNLHKMWMSSHYTKLATVK